MTNPGATNWLTGETCPCGHPLATDGRVVWCVACGGRRENGMDEFTVRFGLTIPGALSLLWAALTGKSIALVVPGPFRIEQDGNVFTVYSAPSPGAAGGGR